MDARKRTSVNWRNAEIKTIRTTMATSMIGKGVRTYKN